MIKRRRRFKQTIPFRDRLISFAEDLRKAASVMPSCASRDDLLKRASLADTAAHIDEWLNSSGLRPPSRPIQVRNDLPPHG